MNIDRLIHGATNITRAAFLYLEPKSHATAPEFAQCKVCALFSPIRGSCAAMNRRVSPTASCGMFMEGSKVKQPISSYTPQQLGYVNTAVRCENCKWGGAGKRQCRLFLKLNAQNPSIFELDANISPKGCCNAFQRA